MRYNSDFQNLDEFYEVLYSVPPRQNRKRTTPQKVTAQLLAALGNPQQDFKSVLITGSKGKGSVSITLAKLLLETGERVGVFTSPHLFDYRERITVNEQVITQTDLLRLGRQVFTAANQLVITHQDEFPRFFEITTAIAYLYYAEQQVDYAIIETGIGAGSDATNQHNHILSILTNIELEHADVFSDLLGITKEKAGVINKGRPLLLGEISAELSEVILQRAATLSAPVIRYKKSFLVNNSGYYQLRLGEAVFITQSEVNAKNAWLAITACKQLGSGISDAEIIQVLDTLTIHARQEIITKMPFVIVDGAHTQQSAVSLASYVDKVFAGPARKKVLLVSFSAEKNILPVINAFPDVDKIVITKIDNSRSLEVEKIRLIIQSHSKAKIKLIEQPIAAIEKTLAKLKRDDVLIITGSVYLAGFASRQLRI